MTPVRRLFEAHLTVADLKRAMSFYGGVLGFELATVVESRGVAFYWLGGRGASMLGIWEAGSAPQRMQLHTAFEVAPSDLLEAPFRLRAAGIEPRDFFGAPTSEPSVLAWMPAGAVYFNDPDGNLLEYIAMLPESPAPALGVVTWSEWMRRSS